MSNACTCMAIEQGEGFCDCGCDYCAEYCLPVDPEPEVFDDGGDCLGCGMCDDCIEESLAYAEEMERESR